MFITDLSESPQFGKSVRTFEVEPQLIDTLYAEGRVPITSSTWQLYPNQPIILEFGQQSALALVSKCGTYLRPSKTEISYFGIKGRSAEQTLLQSIMKDPEIRLIVVTGPAGTGKTTLIGSYALAQTLELQNYEKMVLAKPLEIVTSTRYWGTVPGDEDQKFSPFLKSYQIMFEGIASNKGVSYVATAMQRGVIDFLPLELMRGATLKNCICWYDEAQNLNPHEMNTLGSRMDDKGQSKLILSGDLNQRDKRIDKDKTGLMQLLSSPQFLNSPLTAHINLVKNERGQLSQLFYDVFDRED